MSKSGHVFHEVFLHINWHCRGNEPLIRPEIENEVHEYIRSYCGNLKGVYFKGIGGTPTHIHMAVQVEPTICPAEMIRKIKGACSHDMNELFGKGTLRGQRGYGVVSFAAMNLKAVVKYIDQQKQHHQKGTERATLENIGDDPEEVLED